MTTITYQAAVYERTVTYVNFSGEERTVSLTFALDPIQLLQVITTIDLGPTKAQLRSKNPASRNADVELSASAQMDTIRDLACRAVGEPSADGESWLPLEDFAQTLAGKAFLTKLVSSEADRQEFAEKVVLAPFRAFVGYAVSDESNSPAEREEYREMLVKMERIFAPKSSDETLEERRERLKAELGALEVE